MNYNFYCYWDNIENENGIEKGFKKDYFSMKAR